VVFPCACKTKKNVELKCGHFICVGCAANVMRKIEIKEKMLKEIKCSQCNAQFEISISFIFIVKKIE